MGSCSTLQTWTLLLALSAVLAVAGCKESKNNDADATEDAVSDTVDDEVSDVVEDGEIDVPDDDAGPTQGTCESPIVLHCGDSLSDQTNVGGESMLQAYSHMCIPDIPEEGPERVYAITGTDASKVSITMTPEDGVDLDIWILEEDCAPDACVLFSSMADEVERLTLTAELGTVYYVVVDGFESAVGGFALDVVCTVPEICDNSEDDNANGLVDCEDSSCWLDQSWECVEDCSNGEDEDFDGLVDCDDTEQCENQPGCYESSCDDDTDDDGDTLLDCADPDCIGIAACAGGAGALGDPCTSNDDCADGACLREIDSGWPGGLCTRWFTGPECDEECPVGGTCFSPLYPLGPSFCLDACTTEVDCRANYECNTTLGGCTGYCDSGDDCTATGYCGDSGLCSIEPEACTGGVDEDGDTLADCDDLDCQFSSDCNAPSAVAGGGTCADATTIDVPGTLPATVLLTGILSAADSDDHVPSCSSSGTSADAVYTFTLTADAFVAIDLVSTYTITPVLSLARHCDEPDLRCDVSRYPDSEHVRLQGSFTPGTYYVYVEAEWGSLGNYTLGVYFSEP